VSAPEKLIIETPEQIALEFLSAGIGSRFLALALDTLLQLALAIAVLVIALLINVIVSQGWPTATIWAAAFVLMVWFLLYFGYFMLFEIRWSGQTPGKRLVGLRVLAASGRPATPYEIAIRNLVRIVDQFPGVYAVGILTVLVTAHQQRLGDLAAGTVVVHERAAAPPNEVSSGTSMVVGPGTRLTSEEFVIVDHFLERRRDLDPEVRVEASYRIATRICERLGTSVPMDSESFLEGLAIAYRNADASRG
jgi:uncharacterized RDD family membrane protein YckC